ncbi:hypothetical protein Tco_1288726, partial [Tanacetum coccineum]
DDDKGNDDDDDDDDDKGNVDDGDNYDNSDDERTELDIDENSNLNQSNEEHEEEEEEYANERVHTPKKHELTNEEDNAKEENEEGEDDAEDMYRDINVEEDAHVTLTAVHDTQKTDGPMQSSSVSSDFTDKLLNFENAYLTDNTMMDTTVHHEEPSSQTSSLFTIPITVIPEITSTFTTTIPPPPPSFNTLSQQATRTPTPTASEVTTSFPALPDFSSIFKFNDRVTNLEKDMSEMKQVDHYAQVISLIPAIIDLYINNKLGEDIYKAIQSHIAECRNEAQVEKREYIDLIDTSVRAIIKEEVNTQLPQAVLDFATPVIKQNVIESLEADVLAKSSSQPKSTYAVAASLSEFELTKILMDKMEEHKSYLRADYKRSFMMHWSRDDKVKDQDPFVGSDRETKKRKSSKEAESSRDPRSKEKFNTGNNDEQPDDEDASKIDWFKKPEQPLTPEPGWNKRQHVDFKPPQTWISNIAHVENLIRHSMSSWILQSTSLHLS